jgi:hypothetical protein
MNEITRATRSAKSRSLRRGFLVTYDSLRTGWVTVYAIVPTQSQLVGAGPPRTRPAHILPIGSVARQERLPPPLAPPQSGACTAEDRDSWPANRRHPRSSLAAIAIVAAVPPDQVLPVGLGSYPFSSKWSGHTLGERYSSLIRAHFHPQRCKKQVRFHLHYSYNLYPVPPGRPCARTVRRNKKPRPSAAASLPFPIVELL